MKESSKASQLLIRDSLNKLCFQLYFYVRTYFLRCGGARSCLLINLIIGFYELSLTYATALIIVIIIRLIVMQAHGS